MNNFPHRHASHGNLVRTAFGSDGATPHNARKAHEAKKRALLKGGLYSPMRAQCVYQAYKVSLTFLGQISLRPLILAIYIYIQALNLEKLDTIGGISTHTCMLPRTFPPLLSTESHLGPLNPHINIFIYLINSLSKIRIW